MKKSAKTKPISPTLKKMEVGETEVFSDDNYSSVASTRDRISREKKFVFKMKSNREKNEVSITRIA